MHSRVHHFNVAAGKDVDILTPVHAVQFIMY